ncbi:MAG: tetratricopeptide repeat protein [Roseovarius sp.]
MTPVQLLLAVAMALLVVPAGAGARMTATERQLALYDCRAGDSAACEALVLSHPHYAEGWIRPQDADRIRSEALAETRGDCDAGDMRACTDHGSLLAVRTPTDTPEVYALYARSCDAGDGFACGLLSDLNFALIGTAGLSYAVFYDAQAKACAEGDATACMSQSRLNVLVRQVVPDSAIWFDQLRGLCDDADAARACTLLSYIQSHEGAEEYAIFDPDWPAQIERKQRYALWDAEKACRLGNPVGCYNAGLGHDEGQAVIRSWKRAQEYYVRACRGGFALGCDEINIETYWRPKDNILAMQKACEAGDFSACHYAAANTFAPLVLHPATEADWARMEEYRAVLREVCRDGWIRGCSDAATMARAARELEEAERHATAACNLMEATGCLVLGNILKLDRGTSEAVTLAAAFHQLGCELKSWIACNNLGDSYERGTGVGANSDQAARYYLIACNNDVARGCRNLARLNETRSPDDAEPYWQQACNLDAQYCRRD